MKVEELSQYGKGIEMPKEGFKKQASIMLKLIKKEFGLIGLIGILINMQKEAKRLKKEYPEAMEYAKNIGHKMDQEASTMCGLFYAIANKRGRVFAGEFMNNVIQHIAPISMPALYQLDELIKCEGDIFTNYKKYNRAMFQEVHNIGVWKNDGFTETDDLLEFKIVNCANIKIFEALGCPELSTMGCNHDLAGYPLIEEATQSEFRRHCTLAKGGNCCHFQFYRKGTAPDSAQQNQ